MAGRRSRHDFIVQGQAHLFLGTSMTPNEGKAWRLIGQVATSLEARELWLVRGSA